MKKTELVANIAKEAGISATEAGKALAAFIKVTEEALKAGDKVQITGFGSFEVAERPARTGRNPFTGEEMKIAASKAPRFKAGKALKDALN